MLGRKRSAAPSLEERLRAVREQQDPSAVDQIDEIAEMARPAEPIVAPDADVVVAQQPAPQIAEPVAAVESDGPLQSSGPIETPADPSRSCAVAVERAEPRPEAATAPEAETTSNEGVLAEVSALLWAASEGDTFLPVDDGGALPLLRRGSQPARPTPPTPPASPAPTTQLAQLAQPAETAPETRRVAYDRTRAAQDTPQALRDSPRFFETALLTTPMGAPVGTVVAPVNAQTATLEADRSQLEHTITPVESEITWPLEVARPEEPAAPIAETAPAPEPEVVVEPATPETPAAPSPTEGPISRRLVRVHGLRRRATEGAKTKVVAVESEPALPEPDVSEIDASAWSTRADRSARFGRIGTTMIERNLITNEQLDTALEVQRSTGRRVGEILVGMGAISRFDLARVLADHMGVPFVDLRAKPPDSILGALLPEDVARRYRSLVVDRWNGQLVIAMANPSDLFALDDLQMVMRQPIITAMAVEEDLLIAIDRVYRVSDVETTLDAATSDFVSPSDETVARAAEVDEAPVVRLVNALLEQAIRDHASDLHVEPSSNRVAIRLRVDGVLHDSSDVPLALLRPLVSRVKILANLDIAQNRVAQDGRFSVNVQGRPVDVRVVTVPTTAGESVILRLLDPTRDSLDISSLGLNPAEEARFVPPFFASQGAAFIVGPTGSGKTSTVYTLLSEINSRAKSIISVEDPVEYRLDGIKQIQANPRVGVTFASTLPSILRSDPDIVFIGEVRDAETARIAADASITGHLVLSTLHATRSAAAPMRLIEMGVEPYLVASALTLVAAQRLARKLCDRCALPVEATELAVVRKLLVDDSILDGAAIRRAVGCPACRNTGYAGRLPIFEILPVTEPISRLILDRAPRAQIERAAVEEGMETMQTAALRRVAAGVLSVEEMMRITS